MFVRVSEMMPLSLTEASIYINDERSGNMPLKKGSSRKTISSNVRTEMHEYDKSGSIGNNSHPTSRKKAQKQAVAIALDKARRSGDGSAPARKSASKRTT